MRVIQNENGDAYLSVDDLLVAIDRATPKAHGHPLIGSDEVVERELGKLERKIFDAVSAESN